MKERELKEAHYFSGQHKGINILIVHHGIGDERSGIYPGVAANGTWCYYLLINEKQLPDEYKDDFILKPKFDEKGRLSHDYYSTKITDLDWHHGITFYSKETGADGEPITVKMGCDYSHYWDEGYTYFKEDLYRDAKRSVDKLFEMFPEIKIHSSYYGGYYKLSEGDFNEHGSFVSFEEKIRWNNEYGEKT